MTKSPTESGLPSCHELVANKSAGYVQVTFTFAVTPSPAGTKVWVVASQFAQASAGTAISGAKERSTQSNVEAIGRPSLATTLKDSARCGLARPVYGSAMEAKSPVARIGIWSEIQLEPATGFHGSMKLSC